MSSAVSRKRSHTSSAGISRNGMPIIGTFSSGFITAVHSSSHGFKLGAVFRHHRVSASHAMVCVSECSSRGWGIFEPISAKECPRIVNSRNSSGCKIPTRISRLSTIRGPGAREVSAGVDEVDRANLPGRQRIELGNLLSSS
jgi:hypothetical protein